VPGANACPTSLLLLCRTRMSEPCWFVEDEAGMWRFTTEALCDPDHAALEHGTAAEGLAMLHNECRRVLAARADATARGCACCSPRVMPGMALRRSL